MNPEALTPLAPGLFLLDGSIASDRTTVVRLPNGSLWVHAPGPCTPAVLDGLSHLGPVGHLVAVTAAQAGHLEGWTRSFPDATCWAAPAVVRAAREAGFVLPPTTSLDARAAEVDAVLDVRTARGNGHEEALFLHRPSGTLIVGGLLETRHENQVPAVVAALGRISGHAPALATTPWAVRSRYLGQRRTLVELVRWALDARPTAVIPMRGEQVSTPPAELLAQGLGWVGADGPTPPVARFVFGANPGGAVAFFIALACAVGVLLGLDLPASSGIARFVTAIAVADMVGGVVAMSHEGTRKWWRAQGPAWITGFLGFHILQPLALVAAQGGSGAWGAGLWLTAMLGGALVWLWPSRRGALPLAMLVVGMGTMVFGADSPEPSWFAALYLLKLVGCFSYGVRADSAEQD